LDYRVVSGDIVGRTRPNKMRKSWYAKTFSSTNV
jgi:hypothetical protein